MSNLLRLFIAINLPQHIKERLHQQQQQLDAVGTGIKWTEANNFHLTVKFLGETEQQQVPAIKEALARSVAGSTPFELCLNKLGTFPERGTPRVVWAGLAGDVNSLKTLQRQVENELATIGFSPEKRKFSPHLTLGRIKANPHAQLSATITNINKNENFVDCFTVSSVELMQSQLTKDGPIYNQLESYGIG